LTGNVAALLSPCIFVPVLTYAFGKQNYDWVSMKEIRKGDDHDLAAKAGMDLEQLPGERRQSVIEAEEENTKLNKAFKIASTMTVILTLALLILWPMPMYGTGYIFSQKFFTGWISVGILWLFCSAFAVGIFPVWQGRKTIAHTFKYMFLDATGKWKPTVRHPSHPCSFANYTLTQYFRFMEMQLWLKTNPRVLQHQQRRLSKRRWWPKVVE
jgi:hypothetical protein